MARLAVPTLGARWGPPVIVQNAPGAAGALGVERVVRAAPDGYTLVLPGDAAVVVRVSMGPRLPDEPVRDLAPIMQIGSVTTLLVVSGESPHRSLADIIAAARARPGSVSFAHAGMGTSQHLAGEMLAQMAGLQLTGVPYSDSAQQVLDVQAGRANMSFQGSVLALPRVRDGSLRALGVSSAARYPGLPDVPTIAELGLRGFQATAWFGLYAPTGTPAPVIARINADMKAATEDVEVRRRLHLLGVQIIGRTPEELRQVIAAESPSMRAVLRAAGIQGE
ncbi:Bug family tripartite tricarboxylate transporter substrate binding protein [Falsiroseomonas oryzae]|uniref:Bug family tripartite tricarboxylate transporter substrate binding protein n=1 Tax=Falsiroseomonas oryzae TaxID=2766473 RepID=UPI0022EAC037|nr:tripartite tricarboxylate transporter substrate-binding protein [Roseomonas sp. MO-31]